MADDAPALAATESWRAIILYGLNTATYKIALGQCIARFVAEGRTRITMPELAEAFLDLYAARLANGKPQLAHPGRLTVMERVVHAQRAGALERGQAIDRVAAEAFGDVLPRFHTVGNLNLPARFYHQTASGLVLTDTAFQVFESESRHDLAAELGARWDLLEAAFELKRDGEAVLANDVREVYLARGYRRTGVTRPRPVLNGYQQGVCFYCGERMADGDVHVDHVLPRQFVCHDEVWNLVLAHALCNEHKSDALPSWQYVERLARRTEHFIASNHPLKQKLIAHLGPTAERRAAFVRTVYADAERAIPCKWADLRGSEPEADGFYCTVVRSLAR